MIDFDKNGLKKCFDNEGVSGEVFWFDSVDSTNSFAMRALAEGVAAPFAAVAAEQTAGRGRLDRKWFAPRGATLCISVAVALPDSPDLIHSFTVRCGIEICRALESSFGSKLFLKWPNDIYSADGGKIAGMLSELYISPKEGKKTAVFGVGLNCDFSEAGGGEIPSEIRKNTCDLRSVSSSEISMNKAAALVARAVEIAAAQRDCSGTSELFAARDWLFGREIKVEAAGGFQTGRAAGIDDFGNLALENARGEKMFIPAIEATILKK